MAAGAVLAYSLPVAVLAGYLEIEAFRLDSKLKAESAIQNGDRPADSSLDPIVAGLPSLKQGDLRFFVMPSFSQTDCAFVLRGPDTGQAPSAVLLIAPKRRDPQPISSRIVIRYPFSPSVRSTRALLIAVDRLMDRETGETGQRLDGTTYVVERAGPAGRRWGGNFNTEPGRYEDMAKLVLAFTRANLPHSPCAWAVDGRGHLTFGS